MSPYFVLAGGFSAAFETFTISPCYTEPIVHSDPAKRAHVKPSQRRMFVLHIWQEGRPSSVDGAATLRGSIQDVQTSHIRYFQSLAGLLRVLEEWCQRTDQSGSHHP